MQHGPSNCAVPPSVAARSERIEIHLQTLLNTENKMAVFARCSLSPPIRVSEFGGIFRKNADFPVTARVSSQQ